MKRGPSCPMFAVPRFMVVLWLVTCASSPVVLAGTPDHGRTVISVMTQNVSMGTDFQEVVAARTFDELLQGVTTVYQNVLARKPAERMAAIAREIAKRKPDLVGLQEIAIMRTQRPPAAPIVEVDLLQMVLDELGRLGERYSAVAVVTGLDAAAPSSLGLVVRMTVQDVILARSDGPGNELTVSNVQAHQYQAQLTFPSPVGPISRPAGWASVDVQLRDRQFRFATTHLTPDLDPTVPLAQAAELIETAGDTELPIVLVGDFNSTANDPLHPTFATYRRLVDAGFADAWLDGGHRGPGLTCCQATDLANENSSLSVRIDLVLAAGGTALVADVVGDEQSDRTSSGLWPSDHAGVFARLLVPELEKPPRH
jgi:endonuclease/exonuclease/phosphatase family metal-dependent hydrolase